MDDASSERSREKNRGLVPTSILKNLTLPYPDLFGQKKSSRSRDISHNNKNNNKNNRARSRIVPSSHIGSDLKREGADLSSERSSARFRDHRSPSFSFFAEIEEPLPFNSSRGWFSFVP